MEAATVVPGTAEEIPDDADQAQPAPSQEVAVVPPAAGAFIAAYEPKEILAKAHAIAKPLADLIESAELSKNLGGNRKHVEVGGWQAAGAMLGALGGQALHAETVWTRRVANAAGEPERTRYTAVVKRYYSKKDGGGLKSETTYDVDGFSWEAAVEVRLPDGTVVGRAEAMCGREETTWGQRDDYALRSMAETRAESRAYRRAIGWIVHLAGYSPTPAEEMGHTPGADSAPASTGPAFGPALPDVDRRGLMQALEQIAQVRPRDEPDEDAKLLAREMAKALKAHGGGYMPQIVGHALMEVALQRHAQLKRVLAGHQDQAAEQPDAPSVADQIMASGAPAQEPLDGVDVETTQPPPAPLDGTSGDRVAGTVDPPADLVEGEHPATMIAKFRKAGCTCLNPHDRNEKPADDCPIKGHGIAF